MKISARKVRYFRQARAGLVEPFETQEEAARQLAGIQAQILPAAAISLYNRTQGLTYEAFLDQLHKERSLIKMWGQRGTLHLYPSSDWPIVHSALSGRKTWWERKIIQKGGDLKAFHRAIDDIESYLRTHKTITRSELRDSEIELEDFLMSSWGGIFHELTRRGITCHAGTEGNEARFAHREHWLPHLEWAPPAKKDANIDIAKRYFRNYGPSTIRDLAYWRGATLKDTKIWVEAFKDDLVEVEVDGETLLLFEDDLDELRARPPEKESWPTHMLYRFDPHLLAHKDKTWLVPQKHYNQVWRPAGHIEGCVLEHGRLCGTWRYDRTKNGLLVTAYPFTRFSKETKERLEELAPRFATFFGVPFDDLLIKRYEG
ncbi:MAG TPA: winged helix DNA-binding domain-containing protein [Myxococcales bacterium]|nr:hypothetical protein [Deltaproteobacteria bacterium]MBU49950.1 hypothetical protein [Deltaproteobacteria bacterium]HAA58750.1 winged helix DNA-binding domain-containing protein [Myxococcales bacterium]|tara:strand:- start:13564 stop:14682 length:1119 start_codon:yes stop_codon:yes gene_type:complete